MRRARLYGWAAGYLLLWAGQLAHRHGDVHLFTHVRAAVKAGNSAQCVEGRCVLDA